MIEELAGKGVDRVIRLVNNRRIKRWEPERAPFHTREHLRRFALLASMVAGREVRVVDLKGDPRPCPYRPVLHRMAHPSVLPEYGYGWCDGRTIYLPVSLVDMPDRGQQEGLARLLVFFLSAQARWGTLNAAALNRGLLERDRLLADIFWITENTRLFFLIRREFPGVLRGWERMAEHLVTRRPASKYLGTAERRVESYLMESIAATFTDGSAAAPAGSPWESLAIAGRIREEWLGEGVKLGDYRAMVPFPAWGRLVPQRLECDSGVEAVRKDPERGGGGGDGEKGPDERSRYIAHRREVDEEANEQGLMLNIYEKVLSWAEFINVRRPFDDERDDDSAKKADQMEELTVAEVERSTNASFDADLEVDRGPAEGVEEEGVATGKAFLYHEWDYRSLSFRDGFSTVREVDVDGLDGDFVDAVLKENSGIVREVKRRFESITPAAMFVRRQWDGDSIDIDSAVEAVADMEAGRQPDERLYTSYRRIDRDISVLFLVDLSMSTDAWVRDRRVIDHEKEALVIFCEATEGLLDRHAIYGFSGRTRRDCRLYRIKGFSERYCRSIKERIGGLIPYHYTRMGPAVRHATVLLKGESSRVRLLFILSDGKPNDLDIYEGRYGIEDTRMAVKEAEREGIVPFCLTVDTSAHEYLPRLFGRGNYAVVSGIDRLAMRLPELYARMVRRL